VTQQARDKAATDDQSREAFDRLAVERGEDDGMIVHPGVISSVHSREDLDGVTAR
jgi:hypothetical protein